MSTGSYDEASNLVKDPSSPLFVAEIDDVFDKPREPDGGASGGNSYDTEDKPSATTSKGHQSPQKHSIFKKPKASKGLGFLIRAREGAKKGRSKSPLASKSSKSKKHKDKDDDSSLEEFGIYEGGEGEVDENVKAKSEHWQMFLQMQERIKQNVLKTQSNIGKLASGHISPSGRISPGKGKNDDQVSNIRFTNLTERESVSSDRGEATSSQVVAEEDSNNIINYYDSSDLANLIALPHFTVSSPSAFNTQPGTETNFSMDPDAFNDVLGSDQFTAGKSIEPSSAVQEFDLLGLCSDPAPAAQKVSQQSSLNEDLLGLDDFLSQPVSRDMSQENLSTDWFGGLSTAESSAQSSLCPSPVQFDVDLFINQGKLAPESTAVSDLARSLVDDFLQWGAGKSDEPLSRNPFQSDDDVSEEALKPNAFNPFATIVESDDPDTISDFVGDFSEKTPSELPRQDRRIDPFLTDNASTSDITEAFSAMDPFSAGSGTFSAPLDINANSASCVAAAPPPPKRPPQQPHSRKSSRKSSNPFLLSDEDFVSGEVTFNDNFFASRGIFHAPSKDQDGIWGVSSALSSESAPSKDQDGIWGVSSALSSESAPSKDQDGTWGVSSALSSESAPSKDRDGIWGVSSALSSESAPSKDQDGIWGVSSALSSESAPSKDQDGIWGVSSALSSESAPSKDQDSIWGVSSALGSESAPSGAASGPAANPFQDDPFTAANFSADRDQAFGQVLTATIAKPINPFLTASFENIASQAQPLSADNPFAAMVGEKSPAQSPLPSPSRVRSPSPILGTDSLLVAGPSARTDMTFDPLASTLEKIEDPTEPQATDEDPFGSQDDSFAQLARRASVDADEFTGRLKLTIKSKSQVDQKETLSIVPMLPPPPKAPKSPLMPQRENPFNRDSPPEENFASFAEVEEELKKKAEAHAAEVVAATEKREYVRSLTSEDSSPEEEGPMEPLETFYPKEEREFWKLMVRQPTKKKLAGNRFWKLAIIRLGTSKDGPVVRLYMEEKDTEPFQELPLQPCYSISDVSMQQYDQFGKIHTVKIQYIFYRERVGIRPERITPSFVRKPKPNMILDHAPQVSELIKLGSLDIHEITSFVRAMEDTLMKLECQRDKTLTYTKDEVQAEVWDEYIAVIDKDGHVTSQKARVRIFFLAFLTGMPACELGISDRRRKGKEVVGRHDIIPVRTEDWIRIADPEFHHVVDLDTYHKTHNIRFHPLDACQFELVRFRVRPRANRELPLQLGITQVMKGQHFEIRVDLLVTGYHAFSKKCGQFPCEDIELRIKVPEVWIYYFRYEKRFGYGSLKAMARKPGKIKGLERITMMAQGLLTPALMEASVGSAKYEHLYRSVVWRIPRLPERNHGAYKNHLFVLHLSLGQHDEVPDQLEQWADVSFTMPASTVSKAQVRSISVDNPDPPEKWVRYIAKYQYKVEIDNQVETESDKDTSD